MDILIIDDDPRLRDTLVRGLERAGHDARAVDGGSTARAALAERPAEIILLDVMMPDEEGWEVLAALRASGDRTPVIFVTARDAVDERVKGLEAGADDYIIKPFAFDELLARITAVARRHATAAPLSIGPIELQPAQLVAVINGRRIELSPREFGLLSALVEARGETVERATLLRKVWGIDFDPGTNTVDVHVARLRRRLGPTNAGLIRTVVSHGYALDIGTLTQ
ncbi:MAG: response regulator transcription factor [Planctomycetota bacterium]